MVGLISGLLLISLSAFSQAQLDPTVCTPLPYIPGTINGNSKGSPCVFPFVYNKIVRNDCITDAHVFNHPWCATTADYDKDGQWGECPVTTDGPAAGRRCVFPFTYKGTIYNKCTTRDHTQPWCSTSDNYDQDKEWAFCPPYTAHDLPPLPDKFSAKIQWNMYSDKMDMYIEEFFDRDDNIGSVRVTGWAKPGQRTMFISNYDTDEFFQITDYDMPSPDLFNCEVSELNKNLPFVSPFTRNNDSTSDTMVSAVDALKFGLKYPTVYTGRTQLDGVYVEQWDACVYSAERNNATMKIQYFFTDKANWTASSGLDQVPYEIKIVGKDNEGITTHNYRYAHFTNAIREKDVFLTPMYTMCQGRRPTTQKLPTLPKQFSFSSEEIYNQMNYVVSLDEWYDSVNQLFRYDFTPFPENPDNIPNKIKAISDYNTGITYIIDSEIGNCTVTTLKVNDFSSFQLSPNVSRLRSPDEFFDLDKFPVYYKGKKMVRGLQTDIYITTRPYPDEYSKENVAVFEWYFLDDTFSAQIPGKILHRIPVQLAYSVPFIPTTQIQSFYKFVDSEPDMGIYDVSECFVGSEKRHFSFQLKGPYVGNVDRNVMYFKNFVLASIEASTNVRKIRVTNLQVDYDPTYIYLRFTLLGPVTNIVGSVPAPATQVPLEDAARSLENDINNGNFDVMMTINFEDDDTVYLPAVPYSLQERIRLANGTFINKRFSPSTVAPPRTQPTRSTVAPTPTTLQPTKKPSQKSTKPPTQRPQASTQKSMTSTQNRIVCPTGGTGSNAHAQTAPSGLSTGMVAGIGVGTGMAGILLGAIITYFIYSTALKRKYDLDRSVLTMNEITNSTYK